MPASVALAGAVILILVVFAAEHRARAYWSAALLCPFLWYFVVCTRPLVAWFAEFGWTTSLDSGEASDGSLLDRLLYGTLTIVGLRILAKRHVSWREITRANLWLILLLVYSAVSIAWSAYPYVSLKRFIKLAGAFVMALVVLTEPKPLEATVSLIRRCAYIHFPLSIVAAKWFREIGIYWAWDGATEHWKGIAASKNVLGQVAMVGMTIFLFDLLRRSRTGVGKAITVLYFAMGGYLLVGAPHSVSVTSVSVFGLGLMVLLTLRALENRPAQAARFFRLGATAILGLTVLVAVHSVVMFSADSLLGQIMTAFGRDVTLTERTSIWHDMYAIAANSPLFGVGFGGFWIGHEANIPWNATMTWVLSEGHNGYVDTYLQLGWVGIGVLAITIMASLRSVTNGMNDYQFMCLRATFLLVILFVNITETTLLRGDHNLWLLLLLCVTTAPLAWQTEPESVTTTRGLPDSRTETTGYAYRNLRGLG